MSNDPLDTLISRRRFLHVLGVAGMGAAVSACGAGPGGSDESSRGPLQTGGSIKGELSFAHWRAEDKKVFDEIIAGFVKQYPDVRVQQDISPSADYQSTALQKIRGGAVGDVFTAFRGAQFVDMNKAGLFADLSGQSFVSNYEAKLIAPAAQAGKQMGLPYQLVYNMPIYNVDVFERVGVSERPADWDGFLALCAELKRAGVVPIMFPGGEPGNAGQLLNAMVMNNAPSDDMFTKIETGEYKVTDDWFIKTLEQYAQLRPYVQPNATGTAVEPALQVFAQEKAAMLATGDFHIGAVRGLGAKFPIDLIAPITVAAGQAKYEGIHNVTFILGVSTRSKNQPAAVKFVEHLSKPDVAGAYANGTSQHVTVAGVQYTNRDLKATEPWLNRKTLLAPRFQFNDLDIRAAVENAATQVIGGTSPQKAASAAHRIIDQKRS
jgi:raffinose/stachyose/melibiose transport system substrate-binding protein